MNTSPLENAKVVMILSDFEVVINFGSASGAKVGLKVKIYTFGEMAFDPDTQEPLERVEIVRGYGRITNVQARISTVLSTEKNASPVKIRRTLGGTGAISYLLPNTVEESEAPRDAPFESPQIGDLVRFVGGTSSA